MGKIDEGEGEIRIAIQLHIKRLVKKGGMEEAVKFQEMVAIPT
jgi:hypothetical protein